MNKDRQTVRKSAISSRFELTDLFIRQIQKPLKRLEWRCYRHCSTRAEVRDCPQTSFLYSPSLNINNSSSVPQQRKDAGYQ